MDLLQSSRQTFDICQAMDSTPPTSRTWVSQFCTGPTAAGNHVGMPGKKSFDRTPQSKWHFGKCTHVAPNCGDFRNARGWACHDGWCSVRQVVQDPYMLQCRASKALVLWGNWFSSGFASAHKCSDGSHNFFPCFPEVHFSNCFWFGCSALNTTQCTLQESCISRMQQVGN